MHWFPSQSSSMLITAIEYNNEQVVAELLKKGVDPNRPSMKVKQQSTDINLQYVLNDKVVESTGQ